MFLALNVHINSIDKSLESHNMQTPENGGVEPGAPMTAFLSKFPLETGAKLASEPARAKQQLGLALYGLSRFVQRATHYRNQLLGRALDPRQSQTADFSIIEMTPLANELSVEQNIKLEETPIAGWDFSHSETTVSQDLAIFEQEFVERTAYLLSELAQDQPHTDTNADLLSVDRLDLLLTLAQAEANRLMGQLQGYGT